MDAAYQVTEDINSPHEWLLHQLQKWQQRRPGQSLRAFARRLKISPSHLVNLLSGRRKLTVQTASKITAILCVSAEDEVNLLDLIQRESKARTAVSRLAHVVHRRKLQDDEFRRISEWHHFAILANATTDQNQMDLNSLGRGIGISPSQMKAAKRRLVDLGLLEETANGHMKQTNKDLDTTNDVPSLAIRRHHQQVLERAETALNSCSVEKRQFESLTCMIDPDDLPMLKRMISDFHDRFKTIAAKGKNRSAVYILGMQLFPGCVQLSQQGDSL